MPNFMWANIKQLMC